MLSILSLFANLLLVHAALADPSSHRRKNHLSQVNRRVASSATDTSYDNPNWAGAVLAGSYTTVVGTFIVPTLTGSDGSAAAWVGIDGATCQDTLFQAGIAFTLSGGESSYRAWYEWLPDHQSSGFDKIDISAGDEIIVMVHTYSPNSGFVSIENWTQNQSVRQDLTSGFSLCQKEVEWIVEDYTVDESLVTLVDFGSVTFTAMACDASDSIIGPSDANPFDIEQNNTALTSTTVDHLLVTVKYL